ncbi:hypothetical protein FSP39_015675 [Pinctada imbricata]|uniref:Uncharacterized protein n=1 Tax=Pinctada imbricata TaxID=66713 RepID=A0AA89C1L7_PINIB|nr:hypothetical protein FSP39_015675 [Pinctada imbricata]
MQNLVANTIAENKMQSLPKTTYQDHAEQTNLKTDFQEQEVRKPMITMDNIDSVKLDRDLGTPQRGFGAVLPRHNPEYNRFHLETTHRADFTPPDPDFKPVPECPPDFPDQSAAYRKCHSQFTDTADYRRPGRNTWQDESGVYANTHYKRQVMTVHKSYSRECVLISPINMTILE